MEKSWMLNPSILVYLDIAKDTGDQFTIRDILGDFVKRYTPEEIVRQAGVAYLLEIKKFPKSKIRIEFPVQMGSTTKRADIVIVDENNMPLIIGEAKVLISQKSEDQLKSYMMASGAKFGLLMDYSALICLTRKGPSEIQRVDFIPNYFCHSEASEDSIFDEISTKSICKNQILSDFDQISNLTGITNICVAKKNNFIVCFNDDKFEVNENKLHTYKSFRKTILLSGKELPAIDQEKWESFLAEAITKYINEQKNIEVNISEEVRISRFIDSAKTINFKELFPKEVVSQDCTQLVPRGLLYKQFCKDFGMSISRTVFYRICSEFLATRRTSRDRYYLFKQKQTAQALKNLLEDE